MNPALPAPTTVSHPGVVADPFAGAVSRPTFRDRLRVPDQAMAVAAALLLPLGLVLVVLSWWGAARTPFLFEQVPYLISGGLFGLGLVVTGGFVLFGSWIARTAREQRALTVELIEAVRAVRDEVAGLSQAGLAQAGSGETNGGRRRSSTGNGNGTYGSSGAGLVATANGSMLHRPDCVVVSQREDVHAVTAKEAGALSACRLCDPLRSLTA